MFIVFIGFVSGICLFFLSHSEFIFSFAKDNIYNLIVLGIGAGISERWIPNLFETLIKNQKR